MALTRQIHRIISGLALVGGLALSGCAGSSPVPATAVSAADTDDEGLTDLNEHHRHHHQGGVTMFIALSLDSLGLPSDQQIAVTKIQSDLFTKMGPARVGEQSVLNALADGVAAGAIDTAKVDAAIGQLASASGQVHEAVVDALNQLHAVLTPPQRAALVDKVAAQWAIFRQANAEADQVGKGHEAGHLAGLARELGLSADQVDKIGASFQAMMRAAPATLDPAEIDAHLQRFAAFRDDVFDARSLTGGPAANAHLAARGATRMACFYEATSPVLTPEQRAKLVLLLREHAAHDDAAFLAAH
jgi:Spy/CpxP family protein refolding chaperone